MCSRLSTMELNILSALTKISRDLGVLQHPTMTLTECGDTVSVRNKHYTLSTIHMADILSFGWVTQLTSFKNAVANFCDRRHFLFNLQSFLKPWSNGLASSRK